MNPKTMTPHHAVPSPLWAGLVLLLLFMSGCGQPQGELFPPLTPPLVWPATPELPRIRYVGQLAGEKDLKGAVSPWEGLKGTLFGHGKIGILLGPFAVALDPQDRLFVADPPASVIHVMDLQTREYQQISALSHDQSLQSPVALTVADGRLYVADSGLGRICVFDRDGGFQQAFGEELLRRPAGIAYGTARQRLYVADAAQHTLFVFDTQGRYVTRIGQRGAGPGQFNFPTQLWVDDAGCLYVSDTLNYRVQVFSPEGQFLRAFGTQGDRPGNLAHPCGIAVDRRGNVYVVDKQFENVQMFSPQGRVLMAFGREGNAPGAFWLPAGICIDGRHRIFVADSFNKRVQVFELLTEGP